MLLERRERELNLLRERVNRHAASKHFIAGSQAMQDALELAADHGLAPVPEEAGTVFSKAQPKLAVYSHILTLLSDDELTARTRKTYAGPLVVGTDLMSFDVTDVVTSRSWAPKE